MTREEVLALRLQAETGLEWAPRCFSLHTPLPEPKPLQKSTERILVGGRLYALKRPRSVGRRRPRLALPRRDEEP